MATWSTATQDSTSWSNGSQDSSVFTTQTESTGGFFLLAEDSSHILLESSGKIITDQSVADAGWINQSES